MYYPLGVLLAIVVVAPSSLNPDTISDQKCHFNTRFQTRTLKSIPVSDLAFRQKLCHGSLDQSIKKNLFKCISNSYISIFSFSFEIDTKNTFIRSNCSLENHTRFQRKIYTRFQSKKVQKPYPLGRHIAIWLI